MGSWVTPLGDPKNPEKDNYNKDKNLKFKCSGGDSCQTVDCLKLTGGAYKNLFPVYDFRGQKGPNSNSAVDYIGRSCGVTFSFPRLATGSNFNQNNP
jgi:hypothetical protein